MNTNFKHNFYLHFREDRIMVKILKGTRKIGNKEEDKNGGERKDHKLAKFFKDVINEFY